jgi:hypothetical protein
VKMRYPALRGSEEVVFTIFSHALMHGVGVAVQPSYVSRSSAKNPRVLGVLYQIDKGVSHLPLFRTIGDHILLYFERMEA